MNNTTPQTVATKKKPIMPTLLRKFIQTESAGGLIMIGSLLLATLVANSSLYDWYYALIHAKISISYNESVISEDLKDWVKDVLMVFFFLIVSLELKTEMKEGFLSKKGQILLPLVAALGGVVVPTLIFLGFNASNPEHIAGWAIPSATDIAFALAIVVLAGKRVPAAAKIFLLAIAIFDDLLAILIIAFFYSGGLQEVPLLLAVPGLIALYMLHRSNVTQLTPYTIIGIYLWFCLHYSGIHTTIAGVAIGMAIPMRDIDHAQKSPVKRCMHLLHGWVSFMVLPIFAFTAAGISFKGMGLETLTSSVPLGIALGLFFGKQIGIFGATWIMVKTGFASLPSGMKWIHVYGVSIVAGIGFTMSLFIGFLAFDDPHTHTLIKTGVLVGSILSSVFGFIVLRYIAPEPETQEVSDQPTQ